MLLLGPFLLIFCIVVCLFAFMKGATPERIAAGIILANVLTATANYTLFRSQLVDLCIDAMTALALLPLTMSYASLWLGVVMLVYALQFGLDAYYLVLERRMDDLHAVINNLDSIAISCALAIGTLITWMRQRQTSAPALPLSRA